MSRETRQAGQVTEELDGRQPPYAEQGPQGQGTPPECMHKYVTGADGAVYCQKCGTILYDTMFQPYQPPSSLDVSREKSYRPWLIVALVIVLAVTAVVGWKFVTRRPSAIASGEQPSVIDVSREPVQIANDGKLLYKRGDGLQIISLANYSIWGKALCVRAYAGYDKGSTGFPLDLGVAWGDVARSDYRKYVSIGFSNDEVANQWLMFKTKTDDPPWDIDYFECHVSNNHICPASDNIYNALMTVKDGDNVYLEGFLAESEREDGEPILSSSMARNDTAAGACECFYVTRLQVGDKVYK